MSRSSTLLTVLFATIAANLAGAQQGRGGGGPQPTAPVEPPRFQYIGPASEFGRLLSTDVPAFNRTYAGRLPAITLSPLKP